MCLTSSDQRSPLVSIEGLHYNDNLRVLLASAIASNSQTFGFPTSNFRYFSKQLNIFRCTDLAGFTRQN